MHRAFSFPVTVERSRTKQRLEASLVGLCELELRKQRQECLVLGALALGDPPVQHNPGAEAACFRSWGQENLTLRRKLVRSCMFKCNPLPACLSMLNPVKLLITRDFWWPNQSVWRAWTVFLCASFGWKSYWTWLREPPLDTTSCVSVRAQPVGLQNRGVEQAPTWTQADYLMAYCSLLMHFCRFYRSTSSRLCACERIADLLSPLTQSAS